MNKKIILTSIISLLLLVVPASAALAIDSSINKVQKNSLMTNLKMPLYEEALKTGNNHRAVFL
jgi:hypothetical protein